MSFCRVGPACLSGGPEGLAPFVSANGYLYILLRRAVKHPMCFPRVQPTGGSTAVAVTEPTGRMVLTIPPRQRGEGAESVVRGCGRVTGCATRTGQPAPTGDLDAVASAWHALESHGEGGGPSFLHRREAGVGEARRGSLRPGLCARAAGPLAPPRAVPVPEGGDGEGVLPLASVGFQPGAGSDARGARAAPCRGRSARGRPGLVRGKPSPGRPRPAWRAAATATPLASGSRQAGPTAPLEDRPAVAGPPHCDGAWPPAAGDPTSACAESTTRKPRPSGPGQPPPGSPGLACEGPGEARRRRLGCRPPL